MTTLAAIRGVDAQPGKTCGQPDSNVKTKKVAAVGVGRAKGVAE